MTAKHQAPGWTRFALTITTPAKLNPAYRCPYCNKTLPELQTEDPRIIWHACHPDPEAVAHRHYFAGCSRCNQSRGSTTRQSVYPW